MTKEPRDPWPAAARGLEIILAPGTHQATELAGAPDMVIRGGEGVVIEGSIRPGGGEDPCTLRIHDGAHRLQIVGPLEIRGSEGRGLRITGADNIHLADIFSHDHGIESIILGNCPNAILQRLKCTDSRATGATSADRRHGLYVSGNATGTTIEDLEAARVTGSGLQVNGASLGFVISGLQGIHMTFSECGSGGTPPISLMAVRNSVLEEFCVADLGNTNDRWAVLFADGQGPQYACRDNLFQNYTVPDGTHAAEEEGSGSNRFRPGAGWSPEPPPEPEPEPPQAPDVQPYLDEIDDALRVIRRETHRAENALEALETVLAGGGA